MKHKRKWILKSINQIAENYSRLTPPWFFTFVFFLPWFGSVRKRSSSFIYNFVSMNISGIYRFMLRFYGIPAYAENRRYSNKMRYFLFRERASERAAWQMLRLVAYEPYTCIICIIYSTLFVLYIWLSITHESASHSENLQNPYIFDFLKCQKYILYLQLYHYGKKGCQKKFLCQYKIFMYFFFIK